MTKRDDERMRDVLASLGGPSLTRVAVADMRTTYERAIAGTTDRDAKMRARDIGDAARALGSRAPDEAARYRANVTEAGDVVRECIGAMPMLAAFPLADASREAARAHRNADLLGQIAELFGRGVLDMTGTAEPECAAAVRELLAIVAQLRTQSRTDADAWEATANESETQACDEIGARLARARTLAQRFGMTDGLLPAPIRELLAIAETRKPPIGA